MIWSIDNHSKRLLGFNIFCLVRGGNSFARADHHLSQLPSTPAKSLVNAEQGELPRVPARILACVSRVCSRTGHGGARAGPQHKAGSRSVHCRALRRHTLITLIFTPPHTRQSSPDNLNYQLYPTHELMEVKKEPNNILTHP